MKTKVAIHIERDDRVEAIEYRGGVWIEVYGPGEHDGAPVHARTPEGFEAIARAATEAAALLRKVKGQPFDLESELDRTG